MMKNKSIHYALITLLLLVIFIFTGCSQDPLVNNEKTSNDSQIAEIHQRLDDQQSRIEKLESFINEQPDTESSDIEQEKSAATQPAVNHTALNNCLKSADDKYNSAVKKLCKKGYYCDKATIAQQTIVLQNDRDQSKSECYRKYP